MNSDFEIKGGAGEFDAAVIAVVLDQIARDEATASQTRGRPRPGLPAWVRVILPDEPRTPGDIVYPD